MEERKLSATQEAAVEKIRILMKEYTLVMRPSFLYTQKELLKIMKTDLSKLDEEYINKHKIPGELVKKLAKELYDVLMKQGEYDKAITVADHYEL